MTDESRIARLERLVNGDVPQGAPMIIYDPADVPGDATAREAYFAARAGPMGGVFIPDNGRNQEE